MSDLLIQCRGLCKSYGRKNALQGVDLQVDRGRTPGTEWQRENYSH